MAKSRKVVTGLWSKNDIKLLKKIFSNTGTRQVAQELRRPFQAVKKKASRLGLRKTRKYMRTIGRA